MFFLIHVNLKNLFCHSFIKTLKVQRQNATQSWRVLWWRDYGEEEISPSVQECILSKIKNDRKYGKRIPVNNCPIPLLVPYNKLMPFVKSINIGTIYNAYGTLCDGLQEREKIQGCYRSLKELLIMLAEYYLLFRPADLVWFDEADKFYVALGGDGAPFGKYNTACAWLLSFLNLGKGVLSSNENYLLFGAYCSEGCIPVSRFIHKLMVEIAEIQEQIFPVNINGTVVNAKFCIAELPNDMKMLPYLAGELFNSAKYFSTFANVSAGNCKLKHKWQLWCTEIKYLETLGL